MRDHEKSRPGWGTGAADDHQGDGIGTIVAAPRNHRKDLLALLEAVFAIVLLISTLVVMFA